MSHSLATMTVGIVSPGHMGSGLGWALQSGSTDVVTTLAGRSERSRRLAADAGLTVLPSLRDVVARADIVLVVTPPGEARTAAAAVAQATRDAGTTPVVADLNAISPSTVDKLVTIYDGLPFVDGSISGPPPTIRPGARIFLSGPHASRVAGLPWQQHVKPIVLPGPVGQASAVKMCTASVYKGLDGLVAQAMRAAYHYGVLDDVVNELRSTGMDRASAVAVAATKAHRYVPEMQEISAAQQAAGLSPALFQAFAEVYSELARSRIGMADPESVDRSLPPAAVVAGLTEG